MSLYYAGVELCLPKTESITQSALVAWVEANLSTRDVYEFIRHPYWLGENSPPVPFSFAALSEDQPIKLSRLWWPMWGASRWAVGHFLISERQKSAIEQAAPNGGPATLEMQWWDQASQKVDGISPKLYYLPPRPLQQIPFAAGEEGSFYLLTVVDDRFWWNTASTTGDLIVQEGTTTWANLYTTLASKIGITITADAISSAYLQPSAAMSRHYRFVPPILDMVAFNVGQRIVRRLDGTVLARNYANALSDQKADLNLASVQRGMHEAGGQMTASDVNARIPGTISVAFPKTVVLVPNGTFYSLTAAITHKGTSFTKTFRHAAVADFTLIGDTNPNNKTELQALANQVATDYYGWAGANLDLKLAGIINWKIDGYSDTIEWTHGYGRAADAYHRQGPAADYATLDECSTRIQCGSADWGIDLLGSSPTKNSFPWWFDGPGVVNNNWWFRGGIKVTGPWFWFGPTLQQPATVTWSTNQNNYVFPTGNTLLQANVTAAMNLTGIVGYQTGGANTDEQMIEIQNVGNHTASLTSEDLNSSAANRINTPDGATYTLLPTMTATLKYNATAQRWWIVNYPGVSTPGPGTGTVTLVNTGAGLTGGPITVTGTISIDYTHNNVWTGSNTYNGPLVIGGTYTQTPATVTWSGNVNDYTFPSSTLLQANVTAAMNLTGIIGTGADEQMIEIQNVGNHTSTLKNESASSTAANRINTPDGLDYLLLPMQTVTLKYNLAAARWWILDYPGARGTGTVTSISAGTGITLTPNPIIATGSVALTVPVVVSSGGTGNTSLNNHEVLIGQGTSPTASVAPGTTGNVLTSNGTDWTSAAPSTLPIHGRFIKTTVLTSGTSFTTQAGTNTIRLRVWGAGGGGAGAAGGGGGKAGCASGGSSGAYTESTNSVAGSTAFTYAIGAGGTAGGAGQNNGADGGTTSFTPTPASAVASVGGPGGRSVAPSATPIAVQGQSVPSGFGDAGGFGFAIAPYAAYGGNGGSTNAGGGGIGGIVTAVNTAADGSAGLGYGAGGGGGAAIQTANAAGGAGAAGAIIVDEYS